MTPYQAAMSGVKSSMAYYRNSLKKLSALRKQIAPVCTMLKKAKIVPDSITVSEYENSVIVNIRDHSLALKATSALKGLVKEVWAREVRTFGESTPEVEFKSKSDDTNYKISTTPAPNCKVEYEDVVIPAQPERIVRKAKLVCIN